MRASEIPFYEQVLLGRKIDATPIYLEAAYEVPTHVPGAGTNIVHAVKRDMILSHIRASFIAVVVSMPTSVGTEGFYKCLHQTGVYRDMGKDDNPNLLPITSTQSYPVKVSGVTPNPATQDYLGVGNARSNTAALDKGGGGTNGDNVDPLGGDVLLSAIQGFYLRQANTVNVDGMTTEKDWEGFVLLRKGDLFWVHGDDAVGGVNTTGFTVSFEARVNLELYPVSRAGR